MGGTGLKCMKCGNIFRVIYGLGEDRMLQKKLNSEGNKKFKGEDFVCCGKEHLKSLFELGLKDEMLKLQKEWLKILLGKIMGGI